MFAVVVWTVAILMVGEASVRVRAWVRRGEAGTQQAIYEIDPQLGRVVRAGATSRVGEAKTTINHWGLRGPDFDLQKPDSTTRVLCLGASTTFGQPDDDDADIWPRQLSQLLNHSPGGGRFEVLNGAVAGFTVEQSLIHFRRSLARFKPDVVIISHAATSIAAHTRRQFSRGSGVDGNAKPPLSRYLEHASLAYDLIRANTASIRAGQFRRNRGRRLDERGVEHFQTALAQLIDECQRGGASVIVCTFPRAFAADQSDSMRARLAATASFFNPSLGIEGLIDAYEQYNRAIRDVAVRTQAHLADADRRIPRGGSCFKDSVHFSRFGHQQMAELLAERIETLFESPLTQIRIDPTDAVQ
ncbi:MAG: SGNH/GDSL hydrolase family protein [Planctomycetes bacterium]|nr:SGNH/GDSL hydrolase family protein [Planctomycetota bacterium]